MGINFNFLRVSPSLTCFPKKHNKMLDTLIFLSASVLARAFQPRKLVMCSQKVVRLSRQIHIRDLQKIIRAEKKVVEKTHNQNSTSNYFLATTSIVILISRRLSRLRLKTSPRLIMIILLRLLQQQTSKLTTN